MFILLPRKIVTRSLRSSIIFELLAWNTSFQKDLNSEIAFFDHNTQADSHKFVIPTSVITEKRAMSINRRIPRSTLSE